MARKGNGKKRAQAHFSRTTPSPPVPTRVVGPVHPPTSEVVLTLEHSLELVKTVVTATVRELLSEIHVRWLNSYL
jgi:hypothetical protein